MVRLRDHGLHLLLMGLVQGVVFAAIWRTADLQGDVSLPIRLVVDLLAGIPLLVYATEQVPGLTTRPRALIVATLTAIGVALQEYTHWVFDSTTWGSWFPQGLFPTMLLLFVSVHWWVHWRRANPSHHAYRDLFDTTWRNAILCGLGVGLTGLFWGVLFAGAQLFKLIGIDALQDLIEQSWFAIPASTTVFACVVTLGLQREDMIISLRKLLLGLLKWFLPLVLLIATVWAVCLPFTGVSTLFKSASAAWTMLATVALSVLFANAAFQDGSQERPYPRVPGLILSWMWLALIPVAAIAIWALSLRIGQYQWTAERAWGFLVALIALGYAIGYSISLWPLRRNADSHWMPGIAGTNRVMSVLMVIGIVVLASPLGDAFRLQASSQTARTLAMPSASAGKPLPLDLGFVSGTGRWGERAATRLQSATASDPSVDRSIRTLLPAQLATIRERRKPPAKMTKGAPQLVSVNPSMQQAQLWAWLQGQTGTDNMEHRKLQACWSAQPCRVYWLDLNRDGVAEALLFEGALQTMPAVYTWEHDEAKYLGSLSVPVRAGGSSVPLLPLLEAGKVELVPNPWQRVKANDLEFELN